MAHLRYSIKKLTLSFSLTGLGCLAASCSSEPKVKRSSTVIVNTDAVDEDQLSEDIKKNTENPTNTTPQNTSPQQPQYDAAKLGQVAGLAAQCSQTTEFELIASCLQTANVPTDYQNSYQTSLNGVDIEATIFQTTDKNTFAGILVFGLTPSTFYKSYLGLGACTAKPPAYQHIQGSNSPVSSQIELDFTTNGDGNAVVFSAGAFAIANTSGLSFVIETPEKQFYCLDSTHVVAVDANTNPVNDPNNPAVPVNDPNNPAVPVNDPNNPAVPADDPNNPATPVVDRASLLALWTTTVQPTIVANCAMCHNGDPTRWAVGATAEANMDIATAAARFNKATPAAATFITKGSGVAHGGGIQLQAGSNELAAFQAFFAEYAKLPDAVVDNGGVETPVTPVVDPVEPVVNRAMLLQLWTDTANPIIQARCAMCHNGQGTKWAFNANSADANMTLATAALRFNKATPLQATFLVKGTGGMNHNGGNRLPDATELQTLRDFFTEYAKLP